MYLYRLVIRFIAIQRQSPLLVYLQLYDILIIYCELKLFLYKLYLILIYLIIFSYIINMYPELEIMELQRDSKRSF